MEQQPPATTGTTGTPSPPLPPPSAENLPPPQPQLSPSSSSLPPPAPAATSSTSTESIPASPNPNPTPKTSIPPTPPLQQSTLPSSSQSQASQPLPSPSQAKPPVLTRPWQQPTSSLTHFSSHLSSSAASSSSSSPTASAAAVPPQRGGIAIGVPAHHASPPAQAAPFSSPLGQHLGGLGRGSVNVSDSISSAGASQVRPSTHGVAAMGSIGSGSQMRPGAIHQQQRPLQSSIRPPPSPTNQPPSSSQNVQGHGLLRGSSVGSPISHSSSTSQSMQSSNQPWLSSTSQGKPPLPSPSYRPQMNPQSLQQRTHVPQQHHPPLTTASQQQYTSPGPSQPAQSNQSQEQQGQQFPPSRAPQSLPHQQISRIQGSGAQKPYSLATVQAQPITAPMNGKTAGSGSDESCNRILSKRSIHELVNQIDPSEKLEPEVEDILVEIAEEFVESITSFGCSLAKHRKSTSLEAKDVLLHLERNWNITLPGFSADEVKSYRKPVTNDIHKERLAVIKRSVAVSEVVNARNAPGQVASGAKGTLTKAAANILGSPNLKS